MKETTTVLLREAALFELKEYWQHLSGMLRCELRFTPHGSTKVDRMTLALGG